jgi:hypothetical protein
VHSVASFGGIPDQEIAMGDATHDLIGTRNDPGERCAGPLSVALPETFVKDERAILQRELGDLAHQATTVHTPDGAQHFHQLAATELRVVMTAAQVGFIDYLLRAHHPSPGKCDQLLLCIGLKLNSWHSYLP